MSEEIKVLQESIHLSREEMLNDILDHLGYKSIDNVVFEELLEKIESSDNNRLRLLKALEGQVSIEHVLKNRLI